MHIVNYYIILHNFCVSLFFVFLKIKWWNWKLFAWYLWSVLKELYKLSLVEKVFSYILFLLTWPLDGTFLQDTQKICFSGMILIFYRIQLKILFINKIMIFWIKKFQYTTWKPSTLYRTLQPYTFGVRIE